MKGTRCSPRSRPTPCSQWRSGSSRASLPSQSPPAQAIRTKLIEPRGEERFLLDLGRGRRRVAKLKFQTRARKVYVLARLDIDGTPHTNPDGRRLGGTHLHLYREGFEARWAYPLDPGEFDTTSAPVAFRDFCAYCHILQPPTLQESLL